MVEPDEEILGMMEWSLAGTLRFLAKMPLYIKRGHYPPEKLPALRAMLESEVRVIAAYREGTTKNLTPVDKVWGAYLYGWSCVKIKQYAGPSLEFDSYWGEFEALWTERDNALVALGLPPYGENYPTPSPSPKR